MARVLQEFYCGECDGYFFVKLNMALNHEIELRCPNCAHEHRRCIVEGQIYESGRYRTDSKEKVLTSKATYSKLPLTEKMKELHTKNGNRRDGVPHERDPLQQAEFDERWASLASKQG